MGGWKRSTRAGAAGLALAFGMLPAGWAIVVDTGPGFDVGGGWSLYDDRPATPGYQRLAARFTLTDADTISSVQGWLNWDFGGSLSFAVWNDFDGLPGSALYSVTTVLAPTGPNRPDWRGVGSLGWSLAAGDYWLVFQDTPGAGSGAMPAGAPNPMSAYASSPGLLGAEWMHADTLDFGVRINTLPEPPPAMVPEPAAWALWAAGLAVALRAGRTTQRSTRSPSSLAPAVAEMPIDHDAVASSASRRRMSRYAAWISAFSATSSTGSAGRTFTWRVKRPAPCSSSAGSASDAPWKKPMLTWAVKTLT